MEYYVSSFLPWDEVSGLLSEAVTKALGTPLHCCATWQDNIYWYTKIRERSLHKDEVRVLCSTAGVTFTEEYAIFPDDEDYTRDITMDLSLAVLKQNLSFGFERYFYDEKGLLFVNIQPKK